MKPPAWISDYLSIPYVEHGRDESKGLDCWGLVRLVLAERFDTEAPEYNHLYSDRCEQREVEALLAGRSAWEKLEEPEPGSVVWIRHEGHVVHVGIMVTKRHFLHTFPQANTCLTKISDPRFKNRIIGYFKWSPECQ